MGVVFNTPTTTFHHQQHQLHVLVMMAFLSCKQIYLLLATLLMTFEIESRNIVQPHNTTDSEALHQCQNGGTFLSGSQVQGCVCPDKFYGKFCEKKLCKQYVKLRSPDTALYKSLSRVDDHHTRYRLTYRTR